MSRRDSTASALSPDTPGVRLECPAISRVGPICKTLLIAKGVDQHGEHRVKADDTDDIEHHRARCCITYCFRAARGLQPRVAANRPDQDCESRALERPDQKIAERNRLQGLAQVFGGCKTEGRRG